MGSPEENALRQRMRQAVKGIGDRGEMQGIAEQIDLAHLREQVDQRSTVIGRIAHVAGHIVGKLLGE